ncbi:MAG: hypothetical protein U1F53_23320 [Burkholderiaceae bacterium]
MRKLTLLAVMCALGRSATADTADVLSDYVGYTIVAVKTIEGFVDSNKKKGDAFEGCEFDRVVVFTDGTGVTCRTYSYSYSYRPKAVLLAKQVSYQGQQLVLLKMIVNNNSYDVNAR